MVAASAGDADAALRVQRFLAFPREASLIGYFPADIRAIVDNHIPPDTPAVDRNLFLCAIVAAPQRGRVDCLDVIARV